MGYDSARILKPRAMSAIPPPDVLIPQLHTPQGAAHGEGSDDVFSEVMTSTRTAAAPCNSPAGAEYTPWIAKHLQEKPSATAAGGSDSKPFSLVAVPHMGGAAPLHPLPRVPVSLDTAASATLCKSEDLLHSMRETAEEQAPLYAAARALLAQPPPTPMTGLSTSTCVTWHVPPPSPTTSLCNIQGSNRRDSTAFGSSLSSQVPLLHRCKSVCSANWTIVSILPY